MADRDLTPEEARAEVEAFMGEGWTVDAFAMSGGFVVEATHTSGVEVSPPTMDSYRECVAWCKAAWRDAVRPWVALAADRADMECGFGATDATTREKLVARVLKEDSNG